IKAQTWKFQPIIFHVYPFNITIDGKFPSITTVCDLNTKVNPMIFREEDRKTVRECLLEWHCHEIVISQPKLNDGYELKGYGTIKSNDSGGLYLDFICLESNKRIDFKSPVPEDSLDKNQCVEMRATTINGAVISSSGLRIEASFQQMLKEDPKLYRLGLSKIEIFEDYDPVTSHNAYLHLEFNEKVRIPFNKSNTTESSLGTKSLAWNQAVIEHEGFEINLINHDNFTEVYAKGEGLNLPDLRDVLIFYLGFSSGLFIQPYFEYYGDSSGCKTIINSIDIKKVRKSIPSPISDLVYDENNKSLSHFHYELLKNILEVSKKNPNYFESIYSQWTRVWHSFLSPEFSVPMLTISMAVEGILNDIFIPVIDSLARDESFEKEKERIKSIVSSIDGVSSEHLETIQIFVGKWGNTHAKKALHYLSERNIIEALQLKCWEKLRNSSAHPKLLKQDEARVRKNYERTVVCLGLFYRLALNVFSYKGAQYSYKKLKDGKLVIYEYVNLLH
ncbi:MAG: hypothetical protein KKA35_00280, partial [Proteobacteria bacterium]|nr:hypothetical protein [Pseudomonadota bacterium]